MTNRDEEALKELNNLESARLAIRGALATIPDLQDHSLKLKAEIHLPLKYFIVKSTRTFFNYL